MEQALSTAQKALQINVDSKKYGTFAEIGAGQEVARWFFHVGRSSGTVAKSISAYDMSVSDDLYGPTGHYVSRSRLEAMLGREFTQLQERLTEKRGAHSAFFVFANTVATHSHSTRQGQGWMGVRFQNLPGEEPSEIIIHAVLLDPEAVNEQEAVGILGVNLAYGAFYFNHDPGLLVTSLMDGLSRRRIEVDMIKFSGTAFAGVDNRLMSLQLVESGLTDAALFTAGGEVVQPSEVLYDKPVLIERGSFRPVTNVTLDMLNSAQQQLEQDCREHPVGGATSSSWTPPVVLMEMTLKNLMAEDDVDHRDFLARVDLLGALGKTVMISNYTRFDRVTAYLRHSTQNWIAMVMGIPTLREIFEEKYYTDLDGGILEGLGRLFQGPVKLLIYPTRGDAEGEVETPALLAVQPQLRNLYAHLLQNGFIQAIQEFDEAQLHITPGDVLQRLRSGDPSWEQMTPPQAVSLIKERGIFGYTRPVP